MNNRRTKIKLGKCQALDNGGYQCRRKAIDSDDIFTHPEHGCWDWVRVHLCAEHDLAAKRDEAYRKRLKRKARP